MARHAQLELQHQVCFPLYAASRAVTRAYAPLLEPFGLTYPQYLTLLALWSGEGTPRTVGELGQQLRLDSGTLTPVLKRLEAAGLVTRQRDPADERRVVVTLTSEGDELQDRVAHVPAAVVESLHLTAEDAMGLHTLLHRVLDGIESSDS